MTIDRTTMMTPEVLERLFARSSDLRVLALDLLDANPAYPPTRGRSGLARLVADIQVTGFIVPIVVCENGARYTVCDGHRRIAAAHALGCRCINAIVLPAVPTSSDVADVPGGVLAVD